MPFVLGYVCEVARVGGLRCLLERRCKRWLGWGGVIGCGNDRVLVVTSILASCIDGLAVRIRTPSEPFLILTTV